VDRALLVPHQDVPQRILLEQRIIDWQNRAAGIAEYDINALIDQSLDDDLRSAQRLGRHDKTSIGSNIRREQKRTARS
jgi:hypothetical protein